MKILSVDKLKKVSKAYYRDHDGWWFVLKPEYKARNYYSCHTIHEPDIKKLRAALKNIDFESPDDYIYSYNLTDYNDLVVWENNAVLATIEDVNPDSAQDVFCDVVYELRGVEL